jgi:spoIIIJ-associated protein
MNQRMTSVEIQAVTVDDAVRLALEQLQLGVEDVDIEILSDAGPGEDEEALVRVTAKGMASQPTPKAPSRPSGQGGNRGGGGGGNRGPRQPGARRVPGDRPSQRGTPPRAERRAPDDRIDEADEAVAREIVRELLTHMGIRAEVIAIDNPSLMAAEPEDPPTIYIDILGQDLGMLIGRRGEHLAQLQYLVNLLCNRRVNDWTRVVVDVEGYRTRREESLVGLAERVARQVSRSRRPIQLEPMPPNERRIVHLTLRDNPDVATESSGEGSMRRVTVQPRG